MEVVGASFSNLLRISSNTTEKHIRLYAPALLYVKWTYSGGTNEKPLVFHTASAACQPQKNSLCCVRLLICRTDFLEFVSKWIHQYHWCSDLNAGKTLLNPRWQKDRWTSPQPSTPHLNVKEVHPSTFAFNCFSVAQSGCQSSFAVYDTRVCLHPKSVVIKVYSFVESPKLLCESDATTESQPGI